MNYPALNTLIKTHPLWPTVSDEELLDWVNVEAINVTKTSLPNEELLAVILAHRAEFTALTPTNQQIVRDILYIGDTVPTQPGNPARDTLVSIFGGASDTITELASAISETLSRAVNADIIGEIRLGDIEYARTL